MVLKLYANSHARGPSSPVAMVLAEKQIPFELDDDGFILYGSRAIARYLAEKYADQGPALVPTDLKKKALFEQAAATESANFDAQLAKMAPLFTKKLKGESIDEADEAALAEYMAEFSKTLKIYDKILELTLADLFHLARAPLLTNRLGIDVMTSTMVE
ncbi:glutathione S-transferase [Mycena galericulata]|nr:glutathione S-transferase [Mycena galericulata]